MFIDPIDNSKYKIGLEDGTYWVATFKILGKEKGCRSKKFFEFKISKCIVYLKFVLNFTLPAVPRKWVESIKLCLKFGMYWNLKF